MGLFRLEELRMKVRATRVVQMHIGFRDENSLPTYKFARFAHIVRPRTKGPERYAHNIPCNSISLARDSKQLSGIAPQLGDIKSFLAENVIKKLFVGIYRFIARRKKREQRERRRRILSLKFHKRNHKEIFCLSFFLI